MITTSESIILLLYITTLIDGKVTESELKNFNTRVLGYPIFNNISKERLDELKNYLMAKWKSSTQDEVVDHIISLMSEKYHKTAFCFVLEICAGDLDIHKSEKVFVDSLSQKLGIDMDTRKSLMDSIYLRYIPKPLI